MNRVVDTQAGQSSDSFMTVSRRIDILYLSHRLWLTALVHITFESSFGLIGRVVRVTET